MSGEGYYSVHPWEMAPAGMFISPPQVDEMLAPSLPTSVVDQQCSTTDSNSNRALGKVQIPSPDKSHAVIIKAPQATSIKSSLNPMSPAYKPAGMWRVNDKESQPAAKSVKDRVPTPLSPFQSAARNQQNTSSATGENTTSVKRAAHLNSSSISSFETADFFPRNTREFSVREHTYPNRKSSDSEKENKDPEPYAPAKGEESPISPNHFDSNWNPQIPEKAFEKYSATANYEAPAPPPGTPTCIAAAPEPVNIDDSMIPDRQKHSMSPKKREMMLPASQSNQLSIGEPMTSPEKLVARKDELCVVSSPPNTIDFSQKPREWIEGYQAGLQRRAVGADRMGDFLDGYCSGLLKSKPIVSNPGLSPVVASTSSPMKSYSRRPSPAVPSRTSSRLQLVEKAISGRPPLEMAAQSFDTLKQAVLAPHNENALLTPLPDRIHISEAHQNLGAWGKTHNSLVAGAPRREAFSTMNVRQRESTTESALKRQSTIEHTKPYQPTAAARENMPAELSGNEIPLPPSSPTLSAKSVVHSASSGERVTSIASIDSNLHSQWPHRILSPYEWKSNSSIAHVSNMATGYFAQGQFDGTQDTTSSASRMPGQLTEAISSTGTAQRPASIASNTRATAHFSRFREHEGSLDRLSSPPMSPHAVPSPPLSPNTTPVRDHTRRKESSPVKGSSPAKAKFEHLAEKVGIRAASTAHKSPPSAGGDELSSSSPAKRRWRDVWRKQQSSKDE